MVINVNSIQIGAVIDQVNGFCLVNFCCVLNFKAKYCIQKDPGPINPENEFKVKFEFQLIKIGLTIVLML